MDFHIGKSLIFNLANATILFNSTKWEEVVVLKRILRCFELSYGLKINLAESMMVGVGCLEEQIQPLANKIHCKFGKLPFSYLGLPIIAQLRSKVVWRPIVESFERKLSLWKRNSLWAEESLLSSHLFPIFRSITCL